MRNISGASWAARPVIASAIAVMLVATGGLAAAGPTVVSPPPQPSADLPGGNGPCGVDAESVDNPRPGATGLTVSIFEPTGSAAATVAGGRCDSATRPTVFVVHGFGASHPAVYQDLIDHFVSVGNVVVFPTFEVKDFDGDGDIDRADLEESYRVVDTGIAAAVEGTPRVDTRRVGWWGHSHGGGMVPWLVQQGDARGWGRKGLWMSNVAQAFTQLVGTGTIKVPRQTRALTIAFEDDELADKRLGIDVFESLALPATQKRHATINTDDHGDPAFAASHFAPAAGDGAADAVDFLLWRYADVLETCALRHKRCAPDLATVGTWSDGTPITPALVAAHPIDSGPTPAVLAECDAGYAVPPFDLNPRKDHCVDTSGPG